MRGLGRQHRRADGDGEGLPAHAAADRAARRSPRCGRRCAANRSCSTSARRSAPTPQHLSTSRSWARRWRASCSTSTARRVGLLNVGVEEIKGLEEVKAAGRVLRETNLPHLAYHGFVEGDDLGKGTVDVFVTEGFTGNIALKTAEGTAKQIGQYHARRDERRAGCRGSAICSRATRFARCATRWTRAASTAACSSALTASSSRAMAGRTPRASPARSRSATTWCARNCSCKIREMIGQANEARAPPRVATP